MTQIEKDFYRLTKYTSPHGWEVDQYDDILGTEYGAHHLENIGYFLTVGDADNLLFTSHLDTASYESHPTRVKRKQLGSGLVGTDGTTILGADDKAGVAVMLHMIRAKVPGHYMFYVGEERGMKGSLAHIKKLSQEGYPYSQVVSFDRGGDNSIITHQLAEPCASPEYVAALRTELSKHRLVYRGDDTGTYTDSYSHIGRAVEATNLSVGYYRQHTVSEVQDLGFLGVLAEAATKIPWGELPLVGVEGMYDYNRWGDYSLERGLLSKPNLESVLYGTEDYTYDSLRDWVESCPDEAAAALEELLYRGDAPRITEWNGR